MVKDAMWEIECANYATCIYLIYNMLLTSNCYCYWFSKKAGIKDVYQTIDSDQVILFSQKS